MEKDTVKISFRNLEDDRDPFDLQANDMDNDADDNFV